MRKPGKIDLNKSGTTDDFIHLYPILNVSLNGSGKLFLAKTIWNMKKKNMFDLKISKFIQQVLRWKTLVS